MFDLLCIFSRGLFYRYCMQFYLNTLTLSLHGIYIAHCEVISFSIDSFFFSATIAAPSRRGRRWKQHKITTDLQIFQGIQTKWLVCLYLAGNTHPQAGSNRWFISARSQDRFFCFCFASIPSDVILCLDVLCIPGFFQLFLSTYPVTTAFVSFVRIFFLLYVLENCS